MPNDRRPPAPQDRAPDGGSRPLPTDADRRQLERHGISEEQLQSQLDRLGRPPRRTPLARPCTPGDGVVRLTPTDHAPLLARWHEAAAAGRLAKLVPASGAASRMFRDLRLRAGDRPPGDRGRLERLAAEDDPGAAAVLRLLAELSRLPFAGLLAAAAERAGLDYRRLVADGAYVPLLELLLEPRGLGYGQAPKALVAFHRYRAEVRTAFAEHLAESPPYLSDGSATSRITFTVAGPQRAAFEAARSAALAAAGDGACLEIELSVQSPATDTVALDDDGRLLREDDGRLVLRPSGHGALLGNLEALDGDLVLVQNVDNVAERSRHAEIALWRRLLTGHLLRLESRLADCRRRLAAAPRDNGAVEAAFDALGRWLALEPPPALAGAPPAERAGWALDRLDRPLRVCGVVPSAGREPGGGPFWVTEPAGGASGQIVEPPEVDPDDAGQQTIWRSSTHFNPVNMVLAPRGPQQRRRPLAAYVDLDRHLQVRRFHRGRELLTLERPGLWNGSMAGWNTAFVEVPGSTFNPVKTVFDLLRPEHQPAKA